MKHLKITSVLLSAAMCFSMLTSPVMADETETPSETQTTEASDEKDAEEAEEPEEKEPEVVEEPRAPEAEDKREAEDAYLAKGKCGKKLKWTLDKKGTLKITGKGAMYSYKMVSGKGNTPWWKHQNKIKKVVVSKGVTTIGSYSFACCESLTGISLPGSLKTIGEGAFGATPGLKNVSLPKGVKTIGRIAFSESAIESISIPKSVTVIGEGAFALSLLKSVVIPSSVTSIGRSAFECCYNLESVKIQDMHLSSIGYRAFADCQKLTEFDIPLSVTSLGEQAFMGCKSLSKVQLSKNLKCADNVFTGCKDGIDIIKNNYYITGDTFYDFGATGMEARFECRVMYPAIDGSGTVAVISYNPYHERIEIPAYTEVNGVKYKITRIQRTRMDRGVIKELVIGANVQTIDNYAFSGCTYLESVTGGAGLKSIGKRAFEKCPKLKVFNIASKTLKKIGPYAFSGDKAFKTLQVRKTTKLTKSGVKKSLKGSSVKTVKVKKSKVKKYKKIFKKKNCGKKVKVKK